MSNQEKKGVVGKVVEDLAESTKLQHEITKVRHEASLKTPSQASEEFKERHAYAKKPPIEKQKIQLEELKK